MAAADLLAETRLILLGTPSNERCDAPPERKPVESLGEEELIARALAERATRTQSEKMRLQSLEPAKLWTDYTVTNAESGKTYRLALRGWERGESFCSCADYRKNTLGTCKHLMNALAKLRRRFPASERARPFRQKEICVHIRYGEEMELRLLLPEKLNGQAAKVVRSMRDRPIDDVRALVGRVRVGGARSWGDHLPRRRGAHPAPPPPNPHRAPRGRDPR